MLMNLYQHLAMKFAKYDKPDYPFLALSEEVGEVSGKLAKYMRKNGVNLETAILHAKGGRIGAPSQLSDDLKKELGDVYWQLQACCSELGFNLEDVAQTNLDKLGGRADRGTIVGSGDNR